MRINSFCLFFPSISLHPTAIATIERVLLNDNRIYGARVKKDAADLIVSSVDFDLFYF